VDEWHGHNAFIRDGDRIFAPTSLLRGDEAMGTIWSYLDMTALAVEEWGRLAGGLSQDPAVQVVELERELRPQRRARPEMGRGLGRRRGRVSETRRRTGEVRQLRCCRKKA
jgi:hypothetical protein